MKVTIIVLFILAIQPAFSFDFNNLKNMFNALKDADPKVEKENGHCCDPTAVELEQINQCAIDLCGNSGEVDSIYIILNLWYHLL